MHAWLCCVRELLGLLMTWKSLDQLQKGTPNGVGLMPWRTLFTLNP